MTPCAPNGKPLSPQQVAAPDLVDVTLGVCASDPVDRADEHEWPVESLRAFSRCALCGGGAVALRRRREAAGPPSTRRLW